MSKVFGKDFRLKINGVLVSKEVSHAIQGQNDLLQIASRQLEKSWEVTNQQAVVNLDFFVDNEVTAGLETFLSLWKTGGTATFEIGTFVEGELSITFTGLIPTFNMGANVSSYMQAQWQIQTTGEISISVSGAFKARPTNIDEITVYSVKAGTFSYSLRNVKAGTTATGSLSFSGATVSEFGTDYYTSVISGLISGTKYELTVAFSETISIITQFNFTSGPPDQELLSIAEADYLTETGIYEYGLPYTQEPIALDGTVHDFSGNANHGQVKGSPAANFPAGTETLTFSNTSPYTRPTTVTIGGGTATGSYNSGTGVFTLSGAGTIEYLTADGIDVYLCSNVGTFIKWVKGSTSYGITISSVTWTTTNNNAVLQKYGGNKYFPQSIVQATTHFLAGGSSQSFEIEFGYEFYGGAFIVGNNNIASLINIGGGSRIEVNVSSFRIDYLGSIPSNTLYIFSTNSKPDLLEFIPYKFVLTYTHSTTIARLVVTNLNTDTVVIDTGSDISVDLADGIGRTSGTSFIKYEPSKLNGSVKYMKITTNGVVTNYWQDLTISLVDSVGGNNVTTSILKGLLPVKLNADGTTQNEDIQGNPIVNAEKRGRTFFDLGETMERKVTPVDQNFATLPPPNVSNTDYGVEDTSQSVESKWGLIEVVAGAGAALDAEILKLQDLADDPAPKIIKRA